MRTVLKILGTMNAVLKPDSVSEATVSASAVSLSTLSPGASAVVVSVGKGGFVTAVERRLLELGFVHGEQIQVLAEARPGRDPFVVRVGTTTLALRRREAENIWVESAPA